MHYMDQRKALLVLLLTATALYAWAGPAQNVIFMIGDGMGLAHVTMAHYANGAKLNMETMAFSGLATTHCLDSLVTDSAAAGTALATGCKTDSGMIATTPDLKPRLTILEALDKRARKTGLVTTTTISHATPACFAAHVSQRGNEEEIASQLLGSGVDVMLGGGLSYFLPVSSGGRRKDGQDLIEIAKSKGYTVVTDRSGLLRCRSDKVLGLFGKSYLSFELDRNPAREPSLALMTQKAVELLSGTETGFFLMVEGGRIDHAAHSNDIAGVLHDTLMFDKAVGIALDFARKNKDTLVLVTADHETGGLGLSSGKYEIRPDVPSGMSRTCEFIATQINQDLSNVRKVFEFFAGITDLTDEEVASLKKSPDKKSEYSSVNLAGITAIVNKRTMIGWTTGSHSACMVPVMAEGPGAELFTGFMDNTELPKKIARACGFSL
ncbi:MAG: alkaline phosphatase [Candidatus Wallbacteria bacterium]|nr:alkaline phosphatase [Candidatus Wallbacteria bacterium]